MAHLIFEQVTQGFHQFELHILRQAAHVVVRLDALCLAAVRRGGFHHVRVNGALDEELGLACARSLLFKGRNELRPHDAAFFLRLSNTAQGGEEMITCVHADERNTELLLHHCFHRIGFTQPQQTGVDKYRAQVIPNGVVHQGCSDR